MAETQPETAVAPEPAPRTLPAIQEEYQAVCATLGELTYRKAVMELQSLELQKRALELNQEAAKAKSAAAAPEAK